MITTFNQTTDEIGFNANTAKDVLLHRLCMDGVITEEQKDKYSCEWQFIFVKKRWFANWFTKFSPTEDLEKFTLKLVRF